MKKFLISLWATCGFVALGYSIICTLIFDGYIYPKLGVYFSQDSSRIKTGCATDYFERGTRPPMRYMVVDGRTYRTGKIYLHSALFVDVDKNLVPFYDKRHKAELNLKESPNICHEIKYISIIDLGFWKRFYLYDYMGIDLSK